MEPSIPAGADLRLDRVAYWWGAPKRWDVVLFRPPSNYDGLWAFRVVGLPGETVGFDGGNITINGQRLDAPDSLSQLRFTPAPVSAVARLTQPVLVPDNSYFLLGDNSEIANDSRMIGFIKRSQIVGKLLPDAARDE